MIYVHDATALLAYLNGETGDNVVEAALLEPNSVSFAHGMNLCETYYDFLRRTDVATAENALQTLFAAGVQAREDMDTDFYKDAGFLKVTYAPLSLGDTCCLALARRLGATVLTADHHEMDKVEAAGIVPIRFIR